MVLAKVMGKAQRDNDKDSLGCWRARPIAGGMAPSKVVIVSEGKGLYKCVKRLPDTLWERPTVCHIAI